MGLRRGFPTLVCCFALLGFPGGSPGLGVQSGESGSSLPKSEEWIILFDGDEMRDWIPEGSGDWVLRDGTLTGTFGRILTRWCWTDLELSFRFQGEGAALLRVGSPHTGHVGFGQLGYRLELPGGKLRKAGPSSEPLGNKQAIGADWHRVSIVVAGGTYRVLLDEVPVHDWSDQSFLQKGRIGFEASGPTLRITDVRVRALEPSKGAAIPAGNEYCYVCHADFEFDEPLVEVHFSADVGCAACHGPSLSHRQDEDNVTAPDQFYLRSQIDPVCLRCHERHEPRTSVEQEGQMNPVCTDCHGSHRRGQSFMELE